MRWSQLDVHEVFLHPAGEAQGLEELVDAPLYLGDALLVPLRVEEVGEPALGPQVFLHRQELGLAVDDALRPRRVGGVPSLVLV